MLNIGQTATRKGTETHGLIVDTYTNSYGTSRVTMLTGRKSIPVTYDAHELTPYVIQPCDTVGLMDDYGSLWFYEVYDLSTDGFNCLLKDESGMGWYPLSEVTRVIPASIERLRQLTGGES